MDSSSVGPVTTAGLVAHLIGRAVAQLLDWEVSLGRNRLPRVDGRPVFDLSRAWFFDQDAVWAAGSPRVPFGTLAVLASSRLDPARPEQWEHILGRGREWIQFVFNRGPGDEWAVAVRRSQRDWPVVDVLEVRVGYDAPEAIRIIDA